MSDAAGESTPQFDPIIGRDADLAGVLGELRTSRLVSLTGPGGSGKTRLAEAVIDSRREQGADGWFVDASTLSDAELLGPTIVSTVRLEESGARDPMTVLKAFFDGRDCVIALDNLEQLDGAGAFVGTLLSAIPQLRVVTTSRIPLDVRGEIAIAVPTLALPLADDPTSVAASPSGALFLVRARSVGYTDELDEANAADIAALVRRLDGLPLAIELAAARTRIMSPAELARRFDNLGIAALESDGGAPHRSLAAILDWTLNLLTADQVQALAAVSVAAGFDLDLAAELVPDLAIIDAIDALVGLGLVQPVLRTTSVTRFRVLETIRAEVLRRAPAGEVELYRARHAAAMLAIAEREWLRSQTGATGVVERLELDADNFRTALDHFAVTAPARALVLWHRLHPFWESNTRLREGHERLQRASALAPDDSAELARALARHAMNAEAIGESGRDVAVRTLRIARSVGEQTAEIEALLVLAVTALNEGDRELARAVGSDLELLVENGSLAYRARGHESRYLVEATLHGPASDEALEPLLEAVRSAAEATRPQQEMVLSGNLAGAYVHRGDYDSAVRAATRSVELARRLHNRLLPWSLGWLAMSLAATGHNDRAVEALAEIATEALALGSMLQIFDSLLVAMPVANACGQPLVAARIWGTVGAMVERGDADIPRDDQVLAERTMAKVRKGARVIEVELAIRDGRLMDPVEVLRSLPELLAARAPTDAASPSAPRLRYGELTKREIEILALVGQGLSDPQIAEALFISPKTASVHVANIKGKLGVSSRLEIALRARELGLV